MRWDMMINDEMCFKLIFLRKLLIAWKLEILRYHVSNEEITCQPQLMSLSSFHFRFWCTVHNYCSSLFFLAFVSYFYFYSWFVCDTVELSGRYISVAHSTDIQNEEKRKKITKIRTYLAKKQPRNTNDGETAKRNNESQLIVEEEFRKSLNRCVLQCLSAKVKFSYHHVRLVCVIFLLNWLSLFRVL